MRHLFIYLLLASGLFVFTACGSKSGPAVRTNADGTCTDELMDDAYSLQAELSRMHMDSCSDLRDRKGKLEDFLAKYGPESCRSRNGVTYNGSVFPQTLDDLNLRLRSCP